MRACAFDELLPDTSRLRTRIDDEYKPACLAEDVGGGYMGNMQNCVSSSITNGTKSPVSYNYNQNIFDALTLHTSHTLFNFSLVSLIEGRRHLTTTLCPSPVCGFPAVWVVCRSVRCELCLLAGEGAGAGAGRRRMTRGRWRGRPHRRPPRRRASPAPFFLADCGGLSVGWVSLLDVIGGLESALWEGCYRALR